MSTLKLGDIVIWRGSFGEDEPKEAVVVGIELTKHRREKYGKSVQEVDWSAVRDNRVCLSLNANSGQIHWAYGEQVRPKN